MEHMQLERLARREGFDSVEAFVEANLDDLPPDRQAVFGRLRLAGAPAEPPPDLRRGC